MQPDGLVRIALKRAYADGTVAVDMDPLSLLCRLAASVPPPRFDTVKYAGVLAPASAWRARITPRPKAAPEETTAQADDAPKRAGSTYRPWAELLARMFAVDVLECPKCKGRMKQGSVSKRLSPRSGQAPCSGSGSSIRSRSEPSGRSMGTDPFAVGNPRETHPPNAFRPPPRAPSRRPLALAARLARAACYPHNPL